MKALFFSATLRGAEAPVWRRFCVPMDYDFAKLHEVLQILFGYSGREGYEFVFDTKEARMISSCASPQTWISTSATVF